MKEEKKFEDSAYGSSIQAAIAAGHEVANMAAKIETSGEFEYVLVPEGYSLERVDKDINKPARKKGTTVFTDAPSFCFYVNKHKVADETIIIANEDRAMVCAVINDDGASSAAWGDFRASLKLGFSEQWNMWRSKNDALFTQAEFADFMEDRRSDLMTGSFTGEDGREMKMMTAQELSALIDDLKISAEEKMVSKINRSTGETTFSYENKETGKARVQFPSEIYLAIPVYKGADLIRVKIRLRYRKQGGEVRFYFMIEEIERLKQKAFDLICERIGNGSGEDADSKPFVGVGMQVLRGEF